MRLALPRARTVFCASALAYLFLVLVSFVIGVFGETTPSAFSQAIIPYRISVQTDSNGLIVTSVNWPGSGVATSGTVSSAVSAHNSSSAAHSSLLAGLVPTSHLTSASAHLDLFGTKAGTNDHVVAISNHNVSASSHSALLAGLVPTSHLSDASAHSALFGAKLDTNTTVECLGGPRNSWWFDLLATARPRYTSGSTSVVYSTDAKIDRVTASGLVNDYWIEPRVLAFASPETITISATGAAGTYATNILTWISAGTVTVSGVSASRTFTTNLVLAASAGGTVDYYVDGTNGSTRAAMIAAVDPKLAGATIDVFSTLDNTTPTYVRSSTCWAKDADLTPVAAYCGAGGSAAATGILISPRHILMADHNGAYIPTGTVFRFVKADGTVVSRALSSSAKVDGADLRVGLLNSAVDSGIAFAKVLPAAYATKLPNGIMRLPFLAVDQSKRATIMDGNSLTATPTGTLSLQIPQLATRAAFWREKIAWDSGSPVCAIVGTELVLLTVLTSPVGGASVPYYRTEIDEVMTTLGGGYTLTDVDLSSYGDF